MRSLLLASCLAWVAPLLHAQSPVASVPASAPVPAAASQAPGARMAVPVLPPRVVAATDQAQFRWFVLANGLRVLLVHGHLSSDDAVATARALPTAVDARPAEASELMRRRHLVMNAGEHLVDTGLIEGVNAAWVSEYLFGDDTPRLRAASLVLAAFVSPPFATELRTRQQLGYIVGSGLAVSLRQRGLSFTIQSSTHSTVDIAQRADSFISGLPAALAVLPALGKDEAVALLSELLDPAKARRRSVMLDPASKPPKSSAAASFSDREAWKRTRQFR